MIENELETSRKIDLTNYKRIEELERWFRTDYIYRRMTIERYNYLGLKSRESRYDLELEAYDKENELRQLQGRPLLSEIKFRDIF